MGIQEPTASSAKSSGIYARAQSISDRVISRETREKYYTQVNGFARERPYVGTLLLALLLLTTPPLLLFTSFVVSTLLFSFSVALLFSLFWIGVALVVLVPTLCITLVLGTGIWCWGFAVWVVGWWVWGVVGTRLGKVDGRIEANGGKTAYGEVDL